MSVHSYACLTSTVYGRPYAPTTPKTTKKHSSASQSAKSSSSSLSKAEMAFGKLVSSYGFSSGVPSLPTKVPKVKSSKYHRMASPSPTPTLHSSSSETSTKDYEAAFAALSSSYGFSGAPVLPHRRS